MNLFGLNCLLALLWAFLNGSFSFMTLSFGYLLGFVSIWISQPLFEDSSSYLLRAYRVVRLILFFLYDLVVSSIRVTFDVLTPDHKSKPAILEMPLDVKSDLEILLVTNLISLTPGTLSIDVTPDRKTLIIHAMFAHDPERLIKNLKTGIERLVKEVFDNDQ